MWVGDVTFHCFISIHYTTSDTLTVQSNRTTCHFSIKQTMKLIAPASMLLSQCFPPSACNEDMKTGRSGVFLYCSAGLCGDGQALPAPTFDVKSPPLEILHQKKAFQGRQG